jgi:hypothetical protein
LPIVLLALAATHAKATLPVGLALAGLFAWQTVTLRNRAIALPALAAMLVATLGISAFGRGVLLWNLPAETTQLALVLLSALLLWPGSKIDRQLARLPVGAGPNSARTCAVAQVWLWLPCCRGSGASKFGRGALRMRRWRPSRLAGCWPYRHSSGFAWS